MSTSLRSGARCAALIASANRRARSSPGTTSPMADRGWSPITRSAIKLDELAGDLNPGAVHLIRLVDEYEDGGQRLRCRRVRQGTALNPSQPGLLNKRHHLCAGGF